MKPLFSLIVLGSLAALLLWQHNGSQASAPEGRRPPPVTVEVAMSQMLPWVVTETAVGEVKADRFVTLASQQSGVITEVNARVGDEVSAGSLLVALNHDLVDAEISKQQVLIAEAERSLERIKRMREQNLANAQAHDEALTELQSLQAELQHSLRLRAQHEIRAPFSGVVQIHDVQPGQYVAAGSPLIPVLDNRALFVDFTLPARLSQALTEGDEVQISSRFQRQAVNARVISVNQSFDSTSLNLKIRARLPEADAGMLMRVGERVHVSFRHDRDRLVMTVPEDAVNYRSYGENVFVVNEQNVVENTFIKTIGRMDNQAIVLFGLEPGQRVVTAGQNKIYEGLTVQIAEGRRVH